MQSHQCLGCSHLHLAGGCDAFPEKIPEEIISGERDHREPYPGDNGIRFEALKRAKPAAAR